MATKTTKTSNTKNEVQQLQKDLQELESTVVKLSKSLKNDGSHKIEDLRAGVQDAKLAAAEKWSLMRARGYDGLEQTEEVVRQKPLQSLGLAFLGGIIASRLLNR